jgi:hypothetical protein
MIKCALKIEIEKWNFRKNEMFWRLGKGIVVNSVTNGNNSLLFIFLMRLMARIFRFFILFGNIRLPAICFFVMQPSFGPDLGRKFEQR